MLAAHTCQWWNLQAEVLEHGADCAHLSCTFAAFVVAAAASQRHAAPAVDCVLVFAWMLAIIAHPGSQLRSCLLRSAGCYKGPARIWNLLNQDCTAFKGLISEFVQQALATCISTHCLLMSRQAIFHGCEDGHTCWRCRVTPWVKDFPSNLRSHGYNHPCPG